MSKVEQTIIYGGVGAYDAILPVDEVDNYSKIRNENATRDIVCCIKEPRENHPDVDLVAEFKDLPIQNIFVDLKGISKAAASVPNAVAPLKILKRATATPFYNQAETHYNAYNYAKDMKDLEKNDLNTLKNILIQETGDPIDYITDLKLNQMKKVKEQYDDLTILGTPHDPVKLSLVQYFNRS
jgi:hypothetical protein